MHNKIPISWGVCSEYSWELYKDLSNNDILFIEITTQIAGLTQRMVIPVEEKVLGKILEDYNVFTEKEK